MPTHTMSQPCLERYVASGDGAAFDELVREYQGMVYNTCLGVLERPCADVDDAVQETFLKLARSAGSIHGNIAAWLHACARTTALDRRRRQRVRSLREHEIQAFHGADRDQPGAEHEREEQRQVVERCVDELPTRDRDIVVRYYFMNQTQQQIADQLGVSQVAVQKRLSGALEVLRRRCVRRGIAVASLLALLSAQSPAAVPDGLAERLSQLRPTPGGAGIGALGSGTIVAGMLLVAAGATMAWYFGTARASSAVPIAAIAPAKPTVQPKAPAPTPVASAPVAVAPAPLAPFEPSLTLAKWTLSDLKATEEMVDLDGQRVPALHFVTPAKILVGLATTDAPLPAGGYLVDYDYRVTKFLCPFTSVGAEPAYRDVDCRQKPLREVDNRDGDRSPAGSWHHYRAEFRPLDGKIRISIWYDGKPWIRDSVPPAGEALARLHLRVIDGEMDVARVRISPLSDAK